MLATKRSNWDVRFTLESDRLLRRRGNDASVNSGQSASGCASRMLSSRRIPDHPSISVETGEMRAQYARLFTDERGASRFADMDIELTVGFAALPAEPLHFAQFLTP